MHNLEDGCGQGAGHLEIMWDESASFVVKRDGALASRYVNIK